MKKKNFVRSILLTLCLSLRFVTFGNTGLTCCESATGNTAFSTPPTLRFNNIWAEHNAYSDGRKGMFIHLDFNIDGLKGRDCQVVAHFYHENGYPLYNQGGGYRTADGKVATGKNFSPDYENCHSKLRLFIPYGEMHLNGTYSLKYYVAVTCNGRQVGHNSNWETFRLTWRMDVPESDCPKCGC